MKHLILLSVASFFLFGSSAFKPTIKSASKTTILPAGLITIYEPIHLKSGERLQGNKTILELASGANCPMIIVGALDDEAIEETTDVIISGVELKGNKENQKEEIWPNTLIRNNGISIRHANKVIINDVKVSGARSGGLVLEKGCREVAVINSSFCDNYFDGIAGYDSTSCLMANLELNNNGYAGASFDWKFDKNLLVDCRAEGNGHQGVFIRHSNNNNFENWNIERSGRQGVFIAKSELPDSAACGNIFSGMRFAGNKRDWIVNDQECVGNVFSQVDAVLVGLVK